MLFIAIISLVISLNCHQVHATKNQNCDFSDLSDAVSAFNRAQTQECKNEIANLACKSKQQTKLFLNKNLVSDYNIKGKCPNSNKKDLGCVSNDIYIPYLFSISNSSKQNNSISFKQDIKDSSTCIATCLTNYHFKYAGFNESHSSCTCFRTFNSNLKNNLTECNDSKEQIKIFETGLLKTPSNQTSNYQYIEFQDLHIKFNQMKASSNLPRIVFLFTLNGRSIRQVLRIFKTLYDDSHYYYFHVDKRKEYLRKELKKFKLKNVHVPTWSLDTIWGGASLLQMHLKVMQEIIDFKRNNKWDWNFVINLSESDFPIKSIQDLTLFLNENPNKNFLKFRTNLFENFSKNQGLEYVFNQCESRMWRIANRSLPIGLQIDGGSDWFCLNSEFIDYIINSNDEYILELKLFYNFTLLPSESFFHTVLLNSPYCNTAVNSNLRFTNWNRDRGCKCQYKNVVDWCGCSPNLFTHNDWMLIKELKTKPMFIARKFDPLFNSELINNVDQSIFGLYSANFKSLHSYWENIYDIEVDLSTIDSKTKIFVSYCLHQSIKQFESYLEMFEDNFINPNELKLALNNYNFNYLKNVNSFFQADKFKGYVVQINVNNFLFEAYFSPAKRMDLIEINPDFKNKSQSLINKMNLLLNSIAKLEVSSDYDSKERRFNNYGTILDLNCNPSLLIVIDPIEEVLKFKIVWFDSNDKIVKETQVSLDASDKSQLILNGFFRIDTSSVNKNEYNLKTPGVWKIKLVLNDDSTFDNLTVLTFKFLVLPIEDFFKSFNSTNNLESLNDQIDLFWKFESICVKYSDNGLLNRDNLFLISSILNDCENDAHWSSFYSDFKSELFHDVERI